MVFGVRRSGIAALVAVAGSLAACQNVVPANQASLPAAEALFNQRKFVEAYAQAKPLADQGDIKAEWLLARMFGQGGFQFSRDPDQSIFWLTKAASQGDKDAQAALGLDYFNGFGVKIDDQLGLRWARMAADQGSAAGQRLVGFAYEQGRGVSKDYAEGVRWTSLAAEQGDGTALSNLGVDFINGYGVAIDYREALFWYSAAMARMSPGPMMQLAQSGRDQASVHLSQSDAQQVKLEAASWTPTAGSLDHVRALVGVSATGASAGVRQLVSSGSGFVLNKAGYILTDQHVVARCGLVTARLASGAAEAAEIVAIDKTNDLALLKASPAIGVPVAFRSGQAIHQGDPVVLVGFPLNGLLASDLNVTTGSVSALSGLQDDTRKLQFTAPTQSGNSGGPLLDQTGAVVGVAEMTLNSLALAVTTGAQSENANFAIKDSVVETFLDSKGISYETASAGKDKKVADLTSLARNFTVFVECKQ